MNLDEAHRRAEALVKKEKQLGEGLQASTRPNCARRRKRLHGWGRSGWLATPPIRRHRPSTGRVGVTHARRHALLTLVSPRCPPVQGQPKRHLLPIRSAR